MNAASARKLILDAAAERQFAASIVGVGRIAEAVADLQRAHDAGSIDPAVWQERLSTVREPLPEGFDARSVVLMAIPSSEVRVSFRNGGTFELTMPPTYVEYPTLPAKTAAWLNTLLEPYGHHVRPAGRIPLKTLAVRSGLGDYGRNNLCYVPGMGSWAHLLGFYADIESSEDLWREPKILDRCVNCRACVKVCPGGAISTERFVIRAERCVTFHTERPGVPLPDWGKRPSCVFGCMECQTRCPVNRSVPLRREDGPAFDEPETMQLLAGAPLDALSGETVEKLNRLDWIEPYDRLSRNLAGLLR